MELITARLRICPFEPSDIDDLHRQMSDFDVMRYYPVPLTRAESDKWLEGILNDYDTNGFGMMALCLRETDEYIGQAGIMRRLSDGIEHHYLSYLLRKEFWGQGYAIEATREIVRYGFETLRISRIESLIRVDNARSIHLAEKLGMHLESTVFHHGKDHQVWSIMNERAQTSCEGGIPAP
jgi:RimJ/RimL family protein N-acetyltransferase